MVGVAAAWGLVGALALGSAGVGDYASAWRRSAMLEQRGQYGAAAAALEPYAAGYATDYVLQLQLGWLSFQAEEYAAAEGYYRRALRLSGGAIEPLLGLGWTYLRLGQLDKARSYFDAVLARAPAHASATEGRALTPVRARAQLAPAGALALLGYDDHPKKGSILSAGATLAALIDQRIVLSGTYRYSEVFLLASTATSGRRAGGWMGGSGGREATSFAQNEVHLALGVSDQTFGAFVQLARIFESADELGAVNVVGASLRASFFGDLWLDGSVSHYADGNVLRLSPSWRLPLGAYVSLHPGFAYEVMGDARYWSGFATLGVAGEHGRVWLGGKWGDEVRPAYLWQTVIYNVPETIVYGAWLGGAVNVRRDWSVGLSYELQHVRLVDTATSVAWQGNLHLVAASVRCHFN